MWQEKHADGNKLFSTDFYVSNKLYFHFTADVCCFLQALPSVPCSSALVSHPGKPRSPESWMEQTILGFVCLNTTRRLFWSKYVRNLHSAASPSVSVVVHSAPQSRVVSVFVWTQDVVTYYLNLTHANEAYGRWEKEYRLTESFRVPDASPPSMHQVLERMASDRCYLQKYYEFNSVSYDLTECDADCRVDHVCAAREADFESYDICLKEAGASVVVGGGLLPLLSVALSLLSARWFWSDVCGEQMNQCHCRQSVDVLMSGTLNPALRMRLLVVCGCNAGWLI